ncbi:FtsK/SpoIIIE domain-containing protein [Thermostaphylospora chromogena]|uniref:DNA segregation ATPase FtsK/SpoIIIE, S-DNA-T family n=1 Tax=Thermostaphylospora chromogena TaxID=35622 RepID=A0A1H1HE78_9ACTN|nr:FtsK/SpoIIIE domain-containing protein [Thermostaphylospora chromogena]SDR05510.1 DNA segregation ATPase FtsK/SpoIIIE, S-DNA-T family [Thermostaphylospora chromogena]SDR23703.1 DNA segregation ATPase FtsK/SpoIIIE, S-DNA-T family [Thermostaphylospora chromogena]
MTDALTVFAPCLFTLAVILGLVVWNRRHPTSFWLTVGYPRKAVSVYLTWGNVAAGCGLTTKRRRLRWTFDGVPALGTALHAGTVVSQRRKVRRVVVDKPPRLGLVRPLANGFRVTVGLADGQTPDDYAAKLPNLAHAWRVHSVRVLDWKPGRVTLQATRCDPLTRVDVPVLADGLLRVRVGLLETSAPWVIDFRTVPHWLITGATQSGKSTLLNALICGLAPQRVALIGFDLKGGVELTPYRERMTELATERAECVQVLGDLVAEIKRRMALCTAHRVRNIWKLPEQVRPVPVVVLVDEVAELFLMADKSEKDEIAATAVQLIRLAQLGRAFGLYLLVCGQRVGSDLGPGVTALRAQLSGRICHRVNDPETANMTLGDMDPAALQAARLIPANQPGVAILAADDGRWYRVRSVYVSEEQAEHAAATYAHMRPTWAEMTTVTVQPVSEAEFAGYIPDTQPESDPA